MIKPIFFKATSSTDHLHCVNGFTDRTALSYVMAATEIISYPGVLHHQRLVFNCNGTLISWIVGAMITGDYHQNAGQIIIRTQYMPSQAPHTIVLSSLDAASYLNVYEYKHQIFVHQNQYIAVNSTQIYSQRCGLMNEQSGRCIDRPLVVVDAGKIRYYNNTSHNYTCIILPMTQIAKTDVSSVLVGSLV